MFGNKSIKRALSGCGDPTKKNFIKMFTTNVGEIYQAFLQKWTKIFQEASNQTKRAINRESEVLGCDMNLDKHSTSLSFNFLIFSIGIKQCPCLKKDEVYKMPLSIVRCKSKMQGLFTLCPYMLMGGIINLISWLLYSP